MSYDFGTQKALLLTHYCLSSLYTILTPAILWNIVGCLLTLAPLSRRMAAISWRPQHTASCRGVEYLGGRRHADTNNNLITKLYMYNKLYIYRAQYMCITYV